MKKTLAILALLAGFSGPVYAQTKTPVQVVCVRGQGTYKALCGQVKKAVNQSTVFKKANKGNRYTISLYAKNCQNSNPSGEEGCNPGDAVTSVEFGAALSDQLSQVFPYAIATIPWVFNPSQSQALAVGIVDGGLLAAAIIFEAVVGEINSYGASTRQLDEATVENLQRTMKLEIERVMKEQSQMTP